MECQCSKCYYENKIKKLEEENTALKSKLADYGRRIIHLEEYKSNVVLTPVKHPCLFD